MKLKTWQFYLYDDGTDYPPTDCVVIEVKASSYEAAERHANKIKGSLGYYWCSEVIEDD